MSFLSWAWGAGPTKGRLTLEAYFEAAQHPFTASDFQAIFGEGRHSEPSNPGFAGAYRGLLARDGRSPLSRLENAKAASTLLNQAVARDGSDPRWRLLRLTLETEMPGWLGLSSHVQEDRAFLNSLLSKRSNEGKLQTVPRCSEDWSKFYKK
ncbi:MAG: hypothetical protein FJ336_05310 [Sphingomonadales bacterium]|nr:hypothetical protein [Sphingomonadales bacterium]